MQENLQKYPWVDGDIIGDEDFCYYHSLVSSSTFIDLSAYLRTLSYTHIIYLRPIINIVDYKYRISAFIRNAPRDKLYRHVE